MKKKVTPSMTLEYYSPGYYQVKEAVQTLYHEVTDIISKDEAQNLINEGQIKIRFCKAK